MATAIQKLKWELHKKKAQFLTLYGLKNGLVSPYSEGLIKKLRTIYDGGLPASVILLSKGLTNGHCYDRATLLARAFLDEEDDVNLIYADVDGLKLNPKNLDVPEEERNPRYADHCFVERITKDGRHIIYDTSAGFAYDKDLYWKIENPKVRRINDKEAIRRFVNDDEAYHDEDIERDKYVSFIILPCLESVYDRETEMYARPGIKLLQREVEHYKKVIDYPAICKEVEEDMKRLGLRK